MPANNAPAAFSFVPQQSGQDVAKTNRKFINSHLSQVAAQKRSRGAAGRLQRKVVLPARQFDKPKVAIQRLSSSSDRRLDRRLPCIDNQPPTWAGNCKDEDDDQVTALRVESGVASYAKPALNFIDMVLGTGGSDPFHSTLVPVDTTVCELLGFEQEAFFPWSAGIEKGANKDGAFRNKFAQIIPEALEDLCTGYANLARLAAMTATVTSDPSMVAASIKYKGLAYQYMRQSIATLGEDDQANELAMVQMFSLMSMEVADGNSESSAIHSQALLRMMTSNHDGKRTMYIKPSKLLNAVLWHECIRGGNTLRPYVFDPSQVIDHGPGLETLSLAKQKLFGLGYWPHQPTDEDDGFKHSKIPPHLISLVLEIRFLTDMNAALGHAPHLIDDDLMSAYGHRASHLCSKLLGVAHAADRFIRINNVNNPRQRHAQAEKPQQQHQHIHGHGYDNVLPQKRPSDHQTAPLASDPPSDTPATSFRRAHTARATALAAQFALRVVTSHEAVDLQIASAAERVAAQLFAVYGTQRRVLVELRACWEGCFGADKKRSDGGDDEAGGEAGLWLWNLWVGTLAERAEGWLRMRGVGRGRGGGGGAGVSVGGEPESAGELVEGWFNRAFVRHALGLGLRDWDRVKEVLGRFMYFERNTWRSREMFEEGVRRSGGVLGGDLSVGMKQEEK